MLQVSIWVYVASCSLSYGKDSVLAGEGFKKFLEVAEHQRGKDLLEPTSILLDTTTERRRSWRREIKRN